MGREDRKRQRESLDHQERPPCAVGSEEEKAVTRARGRKEEEAEALPSDEEVEEFFAIVRRMSEAVKYLKRKGCGTGGVGVRFGAVLEAETAAAAAVDGEEGENREGAVNHSDRVEKDKGRTIRVEEDGEGREDMDGGGDDRDLLLDLNSSPKDGHGVD